MSKRTAWFWTGAIALPLLAIAGLIAALVWRADDDVDERPPRRLAVRVITAAPRELPDELILPGRLEPWRQATLAAARAGTVTALHVDRGDRVSAGQSLADVDARVWEAAVARARAEWAEAARRLGHLEALHAEGAVSSNDLEGARALVNISGAALNEAEAFHDQARVRAPFDGRIDDRHVELGDFVPEGGRLFVLLETARMKATFDLPEREVGALAAGQPVALELAALGGAMVTGRVTFVAAAAARASNTFRVELELENPDGRLRPGMLADVHLQRGVHRDRIVVPMEAVLPLKGEHVVFIERDGHALRRVVTLAALVGADAVLAGGVAPGDRVIVEGQRALADGVLVEVVEAPAGSATAARGATD